MLAIGYFLCCLTQSDLPYGFMCWFYFQRSVLAPTATLRFRPGVGNLRPACRMRPAKKNHPARSPFTNCSKVMARVVVLSFVN